MNRQENWRSLLSCLFPWSHLLQSCGVTHLKTRNQFFFLDQFLNVLRYERRVTEVTVYEDASLLFLLSCLHPPPSGCFLLRYGPNYFTWDLPRRHLTHACTIPLSRKAIPQWGHGLMTWACVRSKGGERIRAELGPLMSQKSWLQVLQAIFFTFIIRGRNTKFAASLSDDKYETCSAEYRLGDWHPFCNQMVLNCQV